MVAVQDEVGFEKLEKGFATSEGVVVSEQAYGLPLAGWRWPTPFVRGSGLGIVEEHLKETGIPCTIRWSLVPRGFNPSHGDAKCAFNRGFLTYDKSNGVPDCEPPKLCAKLPIVPMLRCCVFGKAEVPGRLKFQFAAPPAPLKY